MTWAWRLSDFWRSRANCKSLIEFGSFGTITVAGVWARTVAVKNNRRAFFIEYPFIPHSPRARLRLRRDRAHHVRFRLRSLKTSRDFDLIYPARSPAHTGFG